MKEKVVQWIENHPDVWGVDEQGTAYLWWVMNCLGTLEVLTWAEVAEIDIEFKKVHGKVTRGE